VCGAVSASKPLAGFLRIVGGCSMPDAELVAKLAEMRSRSFALLLSMAKDRQLDDATIRKGILEEGQRIQRFLSENLEGE
jgi:hypothetical protein